MAALLLAIGASAFTVNQSKPDVPATNVLWHFTGSTIADQTDQEQYEPTTQTNLPDCNGSRLYCVVSAPEDPSNPGTPDLSNLQPTDIISRKP